MYALSKLLPIAFSVLAAIPSAHATENGQFTADRQMTAVERKAAATPISLIRLIATPSKFSNQVVAVRGLLHVEPEDERLYLSREDGDHLIKENALDVVFASRSLLLQPANRNVLPKDRNHALYTFNKRYVLLTGKFSEGQLLNVSRVLELD
jgi:hypothetical protein